MNTSNALGTQLQHAWLLHQKGHLFEAELIYRDIIRRNPKNFDALHFLGILLLQAGRLEQGVDFIARAIKLNKTFANAHYNLGNGLKELKRFKDAASCYDKAIALNPKYAEAYNNRGVALRGLTRSEEALSSFDSAIALKPNYVDAYLNRAGALRALGRLDEALADCGALIKLQHNGLVTYYSRGLIFQDLKRYEEALADYGEAIAIGSKVSFQDKINGEILAFAYKNRGLILQYFGRPEEALESYEKSLAQKPDHHETHHYRGTVLQELDRRVEAIGSWDRAIQLHPDNAVPHLGQGLCFLQMGQFNKGWPSFEWRRRLHDKHLSNRSYSKPQWSGKEDLAGKTLFVHWEEGFGDTMQFYRYAGPLKATGANIVMAVQEPLRKLLTEADAEIKIIGEKEVPDHFDYHCPMLSLPLAFGTTVDTIPSKDRYLFSDELLRKEWYDRLRSFERPRVGIAWSGNKDHTNDHNRSIDLSQFASLLQPGITWVSLQKEVRKSDGPLLKRASIVSFSERLNDFSATAALIDLLDLVITVDTSVAHLAAGMGKPTWILLPHNSDWRWLLDLESSPWYPSAKLFRQDRYGSWASVVERVSADLAQITHLRESSAE